MRLFRRKHLVPQQPTVDPAVRESISANRLRNTLQWTSTAEDIAVGELVREHEERRQIHQEIVLAILVVLAVALLGLIWTRRNATVDRLAEHERTAARQTPYAPAPLP